MKKDTNHPSHAMVVVNNDGSRRFVFCRSMTEAKRKRTELFDEGEAAEISVYVRVTDIDGVKKRKAPQDPPHQIKALIEERLPAACDFVIKDGLVSFSVHGHRLHTRSLGDARHLIDMMK